MKGFKTWTLSAAVLTLFCLGMGACLKAAIPSAQVSAFEKAIAGCGCGGKGKGNGFHESGSLKMKKSNLSEIA